VKASVAGYGHADKQQMQMMVRALLGMSETPEPADAADALAVALCHIQVAQFRARMEAGTSRCSDTNAGIGCLATPESDVRIDSNSSAAECRSPIGKASRGAPPRIQRSRTPVLR
jgi:hypothetical protein